MNRWGRLSVIRVGRVASHSTEKETAITARVDEWRHARGRDRAAAADGADDLTVRLCAGDPAALDEMAASCGPRLYRYLARLAPDAEMARDMTQECLLRAVKALWAGAHPECLLPWRRGLWADLEALSPFSNATRLLARAAVATLIVVVATLGLGLWQGQGASPALLALARAAPLFLAVAWALAWALPFGAVGGALASLLLWGGLTWWGGSLGRWDLFAPPAAGSAMLVQALALGAALALFAVVRAEAGRGARQVRGW